MLGIYLFWIYKAVAFPLIITRSSDGLRCNFDELGEMVTAFPM